MRAFISAMQNAAQTDVTVAQLGAAALIVSALLGGLFTYLSSRSASKSTQATEASTLAVIEHIDHRMDTEEQRNMKRHDENRAAIDRVSDDVTQLRGRVDALDARVDRIHAAPAAGGAV